MYGKSDILQRFAEYHNDSLDLNCFLGSGIIYFGISVLWIMTELIIQHGRIRVEEMENKPFIFSGRIRVEEMENKPFIFSLMATE